MASLISVVQEIDKTFKKGYAAANPNLVGLVILADAVNILADRLIAEGPMGGDYNVIDNIAQALYSVRSAINEVASAVGQIDTSYVHLDGEIDVNNSDTTK